MYIEKRREKGCFDKMMELADMAWESYQAPHTSTIPADVNCIRTR